VKTIVVRVLFGVRFWVPG